ncbi:hypothetical protein XENOCAPTIV_017798 [Xenoophorus captivus]|uniref:Uncharacterized protein n=1 Tax=Xenoophorus captivus TaxID=1517983 RepID=A0ABV0RZA4_9TELE
MMAITFLNLIGIPMEIAFLDGESGLAWESFNVFSDTLFLLDVDLHYHNDDNPSKANKMMRILMFVRILSLIRLARVSRLVRFFNEVEKVRTMQSQLCSAKFSFSHDDYLNFFASSGSCMNGTLGKPL